MRRPRKLDESVAPTIATMPAHLQTDPFKTRSGWKVTPKLTDAAPMIVIEPEHPIWGGPSIAPEQFERAFIWLHPPSESVFTGEEVQEVALSGGARKVVLNASAVRPVMTPAAIALDDAKPDETIREAVAELVREARVPDDARGQFEAAVESCLEKARV